MTASSRHRDERARRLAANGLSRPAGGVVAAARRMLGVQAQDLGQARWALAARAANATRDDVDRAFARAEVVRTWGMRGTLHAVPAEDLPWLVHLLGPRNLARAAGRLRRLEIGPRDVAAARAAAEKALAGRTLSRDELFARLEAAGQPVRDQRGVHLLYCLAQEGVICQAGDPFALAAEWITRPRALGGDEALAELARRYLEGHGPATADDLAHWSGLGKREASRALALAGPVEPVTAAIPPALLLPGYDEYLLGYADRSCCITPDDFERVVPGGNGVFRPMLVLDGRVRGTWTRVKGRGSVTLVVAPFVPLGPARRAAVEEAARAFGAFTGEAVRVRFEAARPA